MKISSSAKADSTEIGVSEIGV